MNSGAGSDRKSNATEEADEARARVSGGGVGSSTDEARVSPMELDSGASPSEGGGPRASEGGGSEDDKSRVRASNVTFNDDIDDEFDISRVEIDDGCDQLDGQDDEDESVEAEKGRAFEQRSLLSEFDEFVANEQSGIALGTTRALSYGFEIGDMVWGKVKSHPWWPGLIFNEAFATSQVRRTRREGHVLVAFFGDSSYGWFDPAELIPFEPNFAEKSRQTNHRGFARAVEEAVDEANRRCGLGVACKCRNAFNFRGTSVQGYFVVDVPEYEAGAVYSEDQIRKARDSFVPSEMLSFVKQVAVSPLDGDQNSLSYNKGKATAFSLRKAVYEEYDETYAQAFGDHSGRPSRSLVPAPTRAPLSGPLVIAEALGGQKSATKPMKIKDHSKKDKYLFKRRDETNNLKAHQTTLGQPSSSATSASLEGSIPLEDGDYMLQKRARTVSTNTEVPAKHEQTELINKSSAVLSLDVSGKDTAIIEQAPANISLTTQDIAVDAKPSIDKVGARHEVKERLAQDEAIGRISTGRLDLLGEEAKEHTKDGTSQLLKQEGEGLVDIKYEESSKSNSSSRMKAAGGVKKAKILKRPAEDLHSEDSLMGDKSKKKRKKQLGEEASFKNAPLTSGKVSPSGSKVAGNSNQVEHRRKAFAATKISSESGGNFPIPGLGNVELDLPQLLSDLQSLALDPFHGVETNSPALARHFFLQFRSRVYQKSLVLSPPSETEPLEVRSYKSPSGEPVKDLPSSKPARPLFRSDDPTIAGRKRGPSDRQGDIAAKRSKKITDIKTLAAEKKASQRPSETKRLEAKESATAVMRKSFKPGFAKKMEPAAKKVEHTMLVMKFPPKTSLPSPAELKAKFARFGPMDQAGLRVFWKSATCRLVFLYKSDAQAAFRFATANSTLFGNFSVRFQLREVDSPDVPESGKGEDIPRGKDSILGKPHALRQQQVLPQSAVQPKSILKKASGEESRGQVTPGGNGNGKGTARVKFMLGGEESSRGADPLMMAGNRNNFNNNSSASIADGGTSSSIAMDFNTTTTTTSRNFQKVNPPPTFSSAPHHLPLPPQYAKPPPPPPHGNVSQHPDISAPPRNGHNLNTPAAFPSAEAPTVDISQQMLSLLTRCNDVVSNVRGLLGYVPYYPL